MSLERLGATVDWSEIHNRLGCVRGWGDSCVLVATTVMDYLEQDLGVPRTELTLKSVRTGEDGWFAHVWVECGQEIIDPEDYQKLYSDLYPKGTIDAEFAREYDKLKQLGLHSLILERGAQAACL